MATLSNQECGGGLGHPKGSGQLGVVGDVQLPVDENAGIVLYLSPQDRSHRRTVGTQWTGELQQGKDRVGVNQVMGHFGRSGVFCGAGDATLGLFPRKPENARHQNKRNNSKNDRSGVHVPPE